ncbi:MAG: DUF2442 domain-containing protein [Anaerolineales bacterium]|nr:DUF2442 domain-containing protein [Anaerolineales bacterium]
MVTSTHDVDTFVQAKSARLDGDVLFVTLTDGREISLPITQMSWLKWLARATPKQRANWKIEPGGFAIYWEDLDDGVEIQHLLSLQSLD